MLYGLLRALTGIALRWYYRGIDVAGADRIPRHGPLIVVTNHPNALVDALLVGWVVPRRVRITAKATLFANGLARAFLGWVGVIPLRRVQDEATSTEPGRNLGSFREVVRSLQRESVVLIFPEGISHDAPALAPLRSGAARMALQALDQGVTDIRILPIGLVFERKEAPRTRVLVQVGDPIVVAEWPRPAARAADALTAEIETRLRAVTLNFGSMDDAAQSAALASALCTLLREDVAEVSEFRRGYEPEARIARRVEQVRAVLPAAPPALRARVLRMAADLRQLATDIDALGIRLEDVGISTSAGRGAGFLLREGRILLLGAPIAAWGELNHYLPLRIARAIGAQGPSAADPAMRTIVAGLVLVLAGYLLQGSLVAWLLGPWWALAYVATLPVAGEVTLHLRDRMQRAGARATAFMRFRRNPALHDSLRQRLQGLKQEALALDLELQALVPGSAPDDTRASAPAPQPDTAPGAPASTGTT
jgi:glycerol-3-phosphate O-acyltransferase / dihydroxyacetone phosphate acyltransferase